MRKVYPPVAMISALLVLSILMLLSCDNVFETDAENPNSDDIASMDYDELVTEGKSYFEAGEHDIALDYLTNAIAKKSTGSLARYYAANVLLSRDFMGDIYWTVNVISTNTNNMFGAIIDLFNNADSNYSLSKTNNSFDTVLDYLDDIAEGNCDGVVSTNNIYLNINIMTVSLFKLLTSMMDSDSDGTYGGSGDLLGISNGSIAFNTAFFNSSISGVTNVVSGLSSMNFNFGDMGYTTLVSMRSSLQSTHDDIESGLTNLLSLSIPGTTYITELDKARVRMSGTISNQLITNLIKQRLGTFEGMLTNFSKIPETIDTLKSNLGSPMNDIHNSLVGEDAFSTIDSFSPSAWNTHNASSGAKYDIDKAISNIEYLTNFGVGNLNSISNYESLTNAFVSALTNGAPSNTMDNFTSNLQTMSNSMLAITNSMTNMDSMTNMESMFSGFSNIFSF